jgi:hypothetical protein
MRIEGAHIDLVIQNGDAAVDCAAAARTSFGRLRVYFQIGRAVRVSSAVTPPPGSLKYITPSTTSGEVSIFSVVLTW